MIGGGLINTLRRDGYSFLAPMPKFRVVDIYNHFLQTRVYNAHVQAKSHRSLPTVVAFGEHDWPMFCHSMEDVVLAPWFFERAMYMFDTARAYFDGDFPYLYSMNAFWTQPQRFGAPYGDTHYWHRDTDCKKQLVIFMYGTDVLEPAQGAHNFITGSHKTPDALDYSNYKPEPDHVQTFLGTAGTMFLTDTNGLHMADRPKQGRRLLLWARWGIDNPPVSYGWDKLAPVDKAKLGDRYPADPTLQKAIQLIAR